jgi:hypothetical protein
METGNPINRTIREAVIMAKLTNKNNDVFIELTLHTTKESPAWINYTLRVFSKKENLVTEFLRLNNENILYFENQIEPEIPLLLEGLRSVIQGTTKNYVFEPLDEKDFNLEIKVSPKDYLVTLFIKEALIFNNYQWNNYTKVGVQMHADTNSISSFIGQLEDEYTKLKF